VVGPWDHYEDLPCQVRVGCASASDGSRGTSGKWFVNFISSRKNSRLQVSPYFCTSIIVIKVHTSSVPLRSQFSLVQILSLHCLKGLFLKQPFENMRSKQLTCFLL
jgi:hypothetical protein